MVITREQLEGAFVAVLLYRAIGAWAWSIKRRRDALRRRNLELAQNLSDHARAVTLLIKDQSSAQLSIAQVREVLGGLAEHSRQLPKAQADALWQALRERAGRNRGEKSAVRSQESGVRSQEWGENAAG